MNIPGLYSQKQIVRLAEDVTYLDSPKVDNHRYTLIETTLIGFLRHRTCRYRTNLRYFTQNPHTERKIYQDIILPWLRHDDGPLKQYLARHSS